MLALGFRIHGGLVAAFGFCYMLFMGSMLSSIAQAPTKAGQPPFPSAFFGLFFMAFIGLALAYGVFSFIAASRVDERRSHTFVIVMAAVSLIFQPLGTVLGILALIVLLRPTVSARFTK